MTASELDFVYIEDENIFAQFKMPDGEVISGRVTHAKESGDPDIFAFVVNNIAYSLHKSHVVFRRKLEEGDNGQD